MSISKKDEIELLQHLADRSGIDHADNCGNCAMRTIQANEAVYELAKDDPDYEDFSERVRRLWGESKYKKLYDELSASGLTVEQIEEKFKEKGWEM